jgi:hypothetical protein
MALIVRKRLVEKSGSQRTYNSFNGVSPVLGVAASVSRTSESNKSELLVLDCIQAE